LKKLFGKTTSPTVLYMDERNKCERDRARISYFFSFISTHVFVREEEKALPIKLF
jgi:hypothetical protein